MGEIKYSVWIEVRFENGHKSRGLFSYSNFQLLHKISSIEEIKVVAEAKFIEELDPEIVQDLVDGKLNLQELEKRAILMALDQTDWVQKDAANLLGITPRCLNYKIEHLEIKHNRWRKNA